MITAIEYLQTNLRPEYRFYPGKLVILTTPNTSTPFMLGNKVYCTGYFDIRNNWYKIIRDDSIDGAITYGMCNYIYTYAEHPEIYKLIKRIQNKVMLPMINNPENSNTKTELVQLRIATNMIMTLKFIEHNEKLVWANWIRDLYWKRKALINQYIIDYILPF